MVAFPMMDSAQFCHKRSIPPVRRAPRKINDFAVTQTPGKTFAVLAGFCHSAA